MRRTIFRIDRSRCRPTDVNMDDRDIRDKRDAKKNGAIVTREIGGDRGASLSSFLSLLIFRSRSNGRNGPTGIKEIKGMPKGKSASVTHEIETIAEHPFHPSYPVYPVNK